MTRRIRRRPGLRTAAVAACVSATLTVAPMTSSAASIDDDPRHLPISVVRAPVDPDGDRAGTPTDLTITFADIDPAVDGIGLREGGTVAIRLPDEFVNTGLLPVAATGSAVDCAPPLVSGCSTAVFLQGWPQSPVLPFPAVTWDQATNTVTVTARADWLPGGISQPGPKQVHLQLFGFDNPRRPGEYRIEVEIRPDPATDEVLRGVGTAHITRATAPNINPNSQGQGAPPPPFANTLFQTVPAGDPSLVMVFYVWDRHTDAYVGVDFPSGSGRFRLISDARGRPIGAVRVEAPHGATAWSLESGGPAALANAIITGIPTGRLTAVLNTDPAVAGTYVLEFLLYGGNRVVHTITTTG